MNLLEQQTSNRRRTWLVMAVFVGFLLLLGLGFDRFFLELSGSVPVGSLLAIGVGSLSAVSMYFTGDRAVLRSTGAVALEQLLAGGPTDPQRLALLQLRNIVDEMAIAGGLPKPAVYIVPDSDPNAFATGRDPEHASLAVTQGLLEMLNRDQLQGVVAHEMSHVRNLDIRLMTIIAALAGGIALLSDWALRGMRFGMGGTSRRGGKKSGGAAAAVFFAIWIVAILLAPIIGRMLAMMVSRRREYLADASGAELTRNPRALAGALERIEAAVEPTPAIKRGSAHLCIADPLGRAAGFRDGFWSNLFASHPPMARRIAALREMAFEDTGRPKAAV